MTLTKQDLIDNIAVSNGIPKQESRQVVESLLEVIKRTLESGEDVLLSGFGKFCVREKNARRGRDIQSGTDLTLNARRIVTFRWSRRLRERMNSK